MANKLDLADAQFIGYSHGKFQGLMEMVREMGLTEREWIEWKAKYPNTYLSAREVKEIDDYFESLKTE